MYRHRAHAPSAEPDSLESQAPTSADPAVASGIAVQESAQGSGLRIGLNLKLSIQGIRRV